jgi:DNA-binding protein
MLMFTWPELQDSEYLRRNIINLLFYNGQLVIRQDETQKAVKHLNMVQHNFSLEVSTKRIKVMTLILVNSRDVSSKYRP